MPECPRCGGGAYLSEEEFVKIIENSDPMRVIARAIFQCRACSEKFSRLVCEYVDAKKKPEEIPASALVGNTPQASTPQRDTPLDGIRFF